MVWTPLVSVSESGLVEGFFLKQNVIPFKSGKISRKDAYCSEEGFFSSGFCYVVQLLVFDT